MVGCTSMWAGSLLEADFSGYDMGPLANQVDQPHSWFVNPPAEGNITSPSASYSSEKILTYFRPTGAVGGSLYVKIEPTLNLDSKARIHFAVDIFRPSPKSTGVVALSNGAATSSPLFGLMVTNAGNLQVNVGNPESGRTSRILVNPSLFKVNEGEWYRLEFEISQSTEGGEGTFDLYVSSPGGETRTALLTSQKYSFINISADRLYLIPNVDSETGGLEIGRISLGKDE